MPRRCSLCGHARRAEIDADLAAGASLDEVLARFGLPSRSALQRHRASHLGRAVTFHLPPSALGTDTVSPEGAAPSVGAFDSSLALERLFARAAASPDRTLQDWVRLTLDGLGHVYAAADALGDHGVSVRALRELRALLQFHAVVPVDKLQGHPGWREPPVPRQPVHDLEAWLLAPWSSNPHAEAEALASLAVTAPEAAAELAAVPPPPA